jgi:hypothetical protein
MRVFRFFGTEGRILRRPSDKGDAIGCADVTNMLAAMPRPGIPTPLDKSRDFL